MKFSVEDHLINIHETNHHRVNVSQQSDQTCGC